MNRNGTSDRAEAKARKLAEARDPNTSPKRLNTLARTRRAASIVASHPAIRPDTVNYLATHGDQSTRHALAYNPATSLAILLTLGHDPSLAYAVRRQHKARALRSFAAIASLTDHQRKALAADTSTSQDDLEVLALHRHPARLAVAKNTASAAAILAGLATDNKRSVRHAVAVNPSTPAELIFTLTRDFSESVRAAVAGRSDLTAAAIDRLRTDPESTVRQSLINNPTVQLPPLIGQKPLSRIA